MITVGYIACKGERSQDQRRKGYKLGETYYKVHQTAVHDESEYVPKAVVVGVCTGWAGQAWDVVRVPGVYSYLINNNSCLRRETLAPNLFAEAREFTQIAQ